MPESAPPPPESDPSPRFGAFDREDLLAHIAMLESRTTDQQDLIDRLVESIETTRTIDAPAPGAEAAPATGAAARQSLYLLAFEAPQQAAELDVLTPWVEDLMRTTYGREVSTNRPWCTRWYDHVEAVVTFHALWLSFQLQTDAESGGLGGPATWHRDFLWPILAQMRAPDGPFAACMTHPDRPTHRVLPPPPPALPRTPTQPAGRLLGLPAAA